MLRNLPKLSLKIANLLFKQKIALTLTYGFSAIRKYIKCSHLREIDKIKSAFIKRVLGVHKSTSSTLCHQFTNLKNFQEEIADVFESNAAVLKNYSDLIEEKNTTFTIKYFTDCATFKSTSWQNANVKSRSFQCRLTSHGFHHLICKDDSFHEWREDCICKYCIYLGESRYLSLVCPNFSLLDLDL